MGKALVFFLCIALVSGLGAGSRLGQYAGSETGDGYEMAEWETAYAEYLDTMEYADRCTYSLIYVDADEIPELVVDFGYEVAGCRILTFQAGEVDVLQTIRREFTYLERKNLICNDSGNMGYYFSRVFTIQDGKWEAVAEGEVYEAHENNELVFDEDGNLVYEYKWEGEAVSEEEYGENLQAVFDAEHEMKPEIYYIFDEMKSVLTTGKITAAGHRYEFVEGDVSWSEACAACEEKGGYLVTITSPEEWTGIQEQMVREGRTETFFWVGAECRRSEGIPFGFRWKEPGIEYGYDMLGLYNALWHGYWLQDEPDYRVEEDDGRRVDEYCVILSYVEEDGRCYLADAPDDILQEYPSYAGKIGYICEYDR